MELCAMEKSTVYCQLSKKVIAGTKLHYNVLWALYRLSFFQQLTVRRWLFHESLACLTDWQITHVLTITNPIWPKNTRTFPTNPNGCVLVACMSKHFTTCKRCLYRGYVSRQRIYNVYDVGHTSRSNYIKSRSKVETRSVRPRSSIGDRGPIYKRS